MKKILPIIIIVALVGVGAYMFLGNKEKGGDSGVIENLQEGASQVKNQKFSTLKTAVALGVPMKCSYSVAGIETEGYIKGEQWRGKVKSQDGQTSEIIIKDNCMWSWGGEQPQGMKICFEPEEGEDSVWDQDAAAVIEYNCSPAAITDDKFTPPSDIEFIDMSQGFDPADFDFQE